MRNYVILCVTVNSK